MKDMQSGCLEYNITDLWATDRPAEGLNGTGQYEEFLFRDHVLDIVEQHDPSNPLLMFYAPHIAHCPLQVPQEWYDKVRRRHCETLRYTYQAVANACDETVYYSLF